MQMRPFCWAIKPVICDDPPPADVRAAARNTISAVGAARRRGRATARMPPHRRGEVNGHNPSDRDPPTTCLLDPRSVFKEPAEVLARADFDATHKRQILERWRHDALELQTADDEAMGGGEEPMMQRVLDALNGLERQTAARRASAAPRPEAPGRHAHGPGQDAPIAQFKPLSADLAGMRTSNVPRNLRLIARHFRTLGLITS